MNADGNCHRRSSYMDTTLLHTRRDVKTALFDFMLHITFLLLAKVAQHFYLDSLQHF